MGSCAAKLLWPVTLLFYLILANLAFVRNGNQRNGEYLRASNNILLYGVLLHYTPLQYTAFCCTIRIHTKSIHFIFGGIIFTVTNIDTIIFITYTILPHYHILQGVGSGCQGVRFYSVSG